MNNSIPWLNNLSLHEIVAREGIILTSVIVQSFTLLLNRLGKKARIHLECLVCADESKMLEIISLISSLILSICYSIY